VLALEIARAHAAGKTGESQGSLLHRASPSVAAEASPRAPQRFTLLAIVTGLAAAHHQMIVLALPSLAVLLAPAAVALYRSRRRRILALVSLSLGIFAFAYALVLVVASRHPFINWGEVDGPDALVRLIGRADYGGLFSPALTGAEGAHVDRFVLFA